MDASHFATLAAYNRWANGRLYDACGALPPGEYERERASFFGSIRNTLNHLLVADRIWLDRIDGEDVTGLRLNDVPYPEFAALRHAREAVDERIARTMARHDDTALARDLVYRNSAGSEFRTPMSWVFTHFFNHQTHHRGQVHDMLSQTGTSPPELDLIYFLREHG